MDSINVLVSGKNNVLNNIKGPLRSRFQNELTKFKDKI